MPANLRVPSASVIASWPTPNYVDPVQRTWFPAFAGTLQAIVTVMVVTRLLLRVAKKAGGLGWDDAFLVPAFVVATIMTTAGIIGSTALHGNRHTWDVPLQDFEGIAFTAFLSELTFMISSGCVKVSVLLFYQRLTQGTYDRRWRYAIYAAIAFTAAYVLSVCLTLIFACNPTEAYWKAYSFAPYEKYHCANVTVLNPVSGVLSVVTDAYSVVLPMIITRHHVIDRRKRLALNCIFSLGLLVVVAGCVRTYYLNQLGITYDIAWTGFDLLVWSIAELDLALICASAPALRVLFRHYLREPISRVVNSGNRSALSRMGHREFRPDQESSVTFSVHARGASPDLQGHGDKVLIRHSIKQSLETVAESNRSLTPVDRRVSVKNPAEFDGYALADLQQSPQDVGTLSATSWYDSPDPQAAHPGRRV